MSEGRARLSQEAQGADDPVRENISALDEVLLAVHPALTSFIVWGH